MHVYYDRVANTLTINGSQFTDNIDISKFSLKLGNHKYTLSGSDSYQFSNSTAFSIVLANPNAILPYLNANNPFTLDLASGWNGVGSAAITSQNVVNSTLSVGLSNLSDYQTPVVDTNTVLNPFAQISINEDNIDNYNLETYQVSISLPAANGHLTDNGMGVLSSASTDGKGNLLYYLTNTSLSNLQSDLKSLYFIPTQHQKAADQTVSTAFNVTVSVSGTVQTLSVSGNGNGLQMDNSGNVLVCTGSGYRVFTESGAKTISNQSIGQPISLAVDSQNNVFIADAANNSVTEFSSSGSIVKTIVTDLQSLCNIVVDKQGDLYVADTSGNLAQYSIKLGSVNWQQTLTATTASDFNDLITNSQGDVFVRTSTDIASFSRSGVLLKTYSIGLSHPSGMVVDSKNNLYVSDAEQGVVKFSASGQSSHFGASNALGASSIASDSQGHIYASYSDGSILEYSTAGVLLKTVLSGAVSKSAPVSMVVNAQGDVFANYGTSLAEIYPAIGTLARASYQTPAISVVSSAAPIISHVYYQASTGQLVLTGSHLFAGLTLSVPAKFTITGQNNQHYTLADDDSTSVDLNLTSDSQVVIDLGKANQLAVNGLLNKVGYQAIDHTDYVFSAPSGWETDSAAIKAMPIGVTTTATAPSLTAANYSASNGILTILGSHLVDMGYVSGILLKNFKLSTGSKSLTLSAQDKCLGMQYGNSSLNSVNIKLSTADQAAVNAFFTTDGNKDGNKAYSLSVSAGWDAGLGAASQLAVNVSGILSINGRAGQSSETSYYSNINQLSNPFAHISITDSNVHASESATITLSSGSLSTTSVGVLTNKGLVKGVSTYTLTASNAANLQSELQSLVYTPDNNPSIKPGTIKLVVSDHVLYSQHQVFSAQISHPNNLFTDSQGNIYTTNASYSDNTLNSSVHNTLLKFSSTGKLLSTLDLDVHAVGLNVTGGFLMDDRNHIFVASQKLYANSQASIKEYSQTGVLLNSITGGLGELGQLALDSQGNVYVANNQNDDGQGGYFANVKEFSAKGVLLNTFANGYSNINTYAVDHSGNVYVLYINRIDVFNHSGTLTGQLSTGLVSPIGISIDSHNHVYVADSGSSAGAGFVAEFINGSLVKKLSVSYPQSQILIDKADNVYIASSVVSEIINTPSIVHEFSASGSLIRTLSSDSMVVRMTLDSQDNLYLGDAVSATAQLEKFAPATNITVSASHTHTFTQVVAGNNTPAVVYTVQPNALNNLTSILSPQAGDSIKIKDATAFVSSQLTIENVNAAGGDINSLAGWVAGALSGQAGAGNLATHSVAWFQFDNNTYLLEQAGKQGDAYSNADTLVQLVGLYDETNAVLHGHELVLV